MYINNKYHNSKIYQITDIGCNKCYIGSTCENLCNRMARHRANYKKFLNGKGSHTRSYDLFNEYGIENCKIELMEYFKCDTLQELRKREGEHIKNTECVNKVVPCRTRKEFYQDNKDKIKERKKEYYQNNIDKMKERDREYKANNKEKIKERRKEYLKNNIDKIKEYCEANKDKIKEYREANKEKLKEYFRAYRIQNIDKMKERDREYYQNNKDKIKEKLNEKKLELYKLKKETCDKS